MSARWASGGAVSGRVLEHQLSAMLLHGSHDAAAVRVMQRCAKVWRAAGETLGPASGATAVWGHFLAPCADALGWRPGEPDVVVLGGLPARAAIAHLPASRLALVALPWGASQDGLRRPATRLGAERAVPWACVCNGVTWRWYDIARPYGREHLSFDLAAATADGRVWQALWLLGQATRTGRAREHATWIDRLVAASASESSDRASALRSGVAAVLGDLSRHARGDHDAHLALVFQWLFLLFAEARGIGPAWHPRVRHSYALSSLAAEARRRGQPAVGLHESIVAAGRLGKEGGRLAELCVPALNGPLFEAALAPRAGRRIRDAAASRLLARLTGHGGAVNGTPLDFAELGVEHLGSIYEHLMAPPADAGQALLRKRTGTYYTPASLADLLVQRTLEPLVRGASADRILSLRILDPAMGSGALLASALRYLTGAVEAAWVREGRGGPLDVPRRERDELPRRIAEQCLFGVDANPRAVQVARLSIWLLSMAPNRPLTWLDAHLRHGNSLVGVSPEMLLARAPVHERVRRTDPGRQLPLFDLERWHHEASRLGAEIAELSLRPSSSAGDVAEKSRRHAALRDDDALVTWRARADAWCGAAMDRIREPGSVWRSVDDAIRDRVGITGHLDACRRRWAGSARAQACLHWSLEFPDVFAGGRSGFDAVLANPPWEMLRGDLGSDDDRTAQRDGIGPLLRFVRRSGVYRTAGGHMNSYQLFVERLLQVVRRDGRVGCLLPGSVLADHGAAPLRRLLLDQATVDRITVLDNRAALFPIHRSMRIVALTCTTAGATEHLLVDDEGVLGTRGDGPPSPPRLLTRSLLARASGDALAVPRVRDAGDLGLLQHLITWPVVGAGGWDLQFGRELNATEDRALLRPGSVHGSLPVVDGKHVLRFVVRPPEDGPSIAESDARQALPAEPWRRWRLCYRDVSSATNTRSLIAALLPPGCVSTHTLFCLRTSTALATQLYLCGMLNSLAADWFVRRYLGSHVTTKLLSSVPVPRPSSRDARRRAVVRLALRRMRDPSDENVESELEAQAAALYGLDAQQRTVLVRDFPRRPDGVRARVLRGANQPRP